MPTFAERHAALTAFLRTHREVWHPRPFVVTQPLPWEVASPPLGAWLDACPDPAFTPGVAPDFTQAPEPLATWAREAAALSALPALPRFDFALDVRGARGIAGRKRAQLEAFVGCVLGSRVSGDHVVDWCAGKGHLGRALSAAGESRHPQTAALPLVAVGESRHPPTAALPLVAAGESRHPQTAALPLVAVGESRHAPTAALPLVAVEWDATLAAAGQALCDVQRRPARFHVLDARGADAAALLRPGSLAVALHACGDLHAALLRAAVSNGVAALAVAPCCYNRATCDAELVLSRTGRAAGLTLDAHDLDLLHRVTVLAGAGERRRMLQGLAWRLALDLWRREVLGESDYQPVPSFPAAWLALPFPEFAARYAASGGLAHSPGPEIAPYERRGHLRMASVLRRDAVRGLFARALEVWLLLDRACLLEEAGYGVELGTFCALADTPRNALLVARASTSF